MTNWDYFDDIPKYHPIIDANNLYDGFKAARKGSHRKSQVQRFRWNLLEEIGKLQKELLRYYNGEKNSYTMQDYSKFTVNERGKIRAITALKIRDRVVKHVLNDLFLIPSIRPHLIYDNGASLKGKGVSFTRGRLAAHLQKFFKETGSNDGYIMTMDFSGYYDNIDHNLAIEMIKKYESDSFARKLTKQAYDSYAIDVSYLTDEEYQIAKQTKFSMVEYRNFLLNKKLNKQKYLHKSLSVGDQTSQITAVAFMTPIDQLVTIISRYRYYGRYMDDLYIIAKTKKDLDQIKIKIEEKAKEMKLFLNLKKIKINKLKHTFTFMQYKYYLKDNGYVVVRINPKTITRMRRRLKKMKRVVRLEKIEEMFRAWIANYSKVISNQQKNNLIELYQKIYNQNLNQWLYSRGLYGC